jgi:hypothetical protein
MGQVNTRRVARTRPWRAGALTLWVRSSHNPESAVFKATRLG